MVNVQDEINTVSVLQKIYVMNRKDLLKKKYRELCFKEYKLRDERCIISDEIHAIEHKEKLKFISSNVHLNKRVKFYEGGVIEEARVRRGTLLAIDTAKAVIEADDGRLEFVELTSEVATPRIRVELLDG